MKGNKFLSVSLAAVLVLLFIFVTVQIPVAHQSIKNLPMALVNEDSGEMGQTFVDMIQEQTKAMQTEEDPMFEWMELETEQKMEEEMANQTFYGAIAIPADYSEKYASLQSPEPSSPELHLYINEGKNATVANIISQSLTGMISQMNQMMSEQILSDMEENNVSLTSEQSRIYSSPIKYTTTMLNEIGTLGNAPLSLFQPIWIASLAGAALLWMAGRNRIFTTATEQLKFRGIQVLISVALGFLAGFSLTWFTTLMLGYEFESFFNVALFLSIASIGFILLILATISWIGIGGIAIFALLMFFGLPLLQLAPEMLPSFYNDWIYPWLPMRFMFDGLREILFFNGSVWNSSAIVLIWIAVITSILLFVKSWVPSRTEKIREATNEK